MTGWASYETAKHARPGGLKQRQSNTASMKGAARLMGPTLSDAPAVSNIYSPSKHEPWARGKTCGHGRFRYSPVSS
jgi:hypothetical protein